MSKCHFPCKEKSKGGAILARSSSVALGGTEGSSQIMVHHRISP